MEQKSTNTFLKSKMNKDLDERLVPNGEYRDAVNIAISKSESSNVGAAENVQGTELLVKIGTEIEALTAAFRRYEVVGQYVHEASGEFYLFLTNQNREDTGVLNDPLYYNTDRQHWVVSYNINSNSITLYAGGPFLNFSTYYRINNVNLLETQLFWTDNYNQPRSLDVTFGIPITSWTSYDNLPYNKEDQISVCTYAPYKPISVYKDAGNGDLVTTLQDAVSSNLPYVTYVDIANNAALANNEVEITNIPSCVTPSEWQPGATVTEGMQCWTSDGQISQNDHAYVSGVAGSVITISLRDGSSPTVFYGGGTYVDGDAKLYIAFLNPNWQEESGETVYPGDQTFLDDKFVRFSYRFKFKNGTYSVVAPYTQECFIPKQYGYFLEGDEDATYQSTIVSFMENMVNRILLQIKMPEDELGRVVYVNELYNSMNISEIDILYKESNSAALQVVQTLDQATLNNYWLQATPNTTVGPIVTFDILKETIPNALSHQRALLRPGGRIFNETAGYTVNIVNVVEDPATPTLITVTVNAAQTWTAGDVLIISQPVYEFDYQNNEPYKVLPENQVTRVYDKVPVKALTQEIISNRITYANYQDKHTPPATIDYQVSVSSKYEPSAASSSKCYVEYPNHTVKQNRNYQVGFVLSDRYGRSSSVILSNNPNKTITLGDSTFGADTVYHYYKNTDDFGGQIENFDNVLDWPGDSIKILVNNIIESVKDFNGSPGLYNGDDTSPDYNPLGWYSYKVVVKQKQQDYYNVYLPYIINGLPQDFGSNIDPALLEANPDIPVAFTEKNLNEQATIVLINDNINKVPRDLSEVGPEQEQFRSSVRLWGRITPQLPLEAPFAPVTWDNYSTTDPYLYNQQYYPDITSDTVSTIAAQNDFYRGYIYQASFLSNVSTGNYEYKPGTEFPALYNTATNPLIATVTTQKAIGASGETDPAGVAVPEDTWPFVLSVYETAPVESRLEIYWETSTSGLISELNTAVLEDTIGVVDSIEDLVYDYKEDRDHAFAYGVGTAAPYFSQADDPTSPQGTLITSDFYFSDALGAAVTTVYILDNENVQWTVQDFNGTNVRWTPDNQDGIFDIRRVPAGDQLANYEFTGIPNTEAYDTFVIELKQNSVYLQDLNIRNFTFVLPTISQNTAGEWVQVDKSFIISLENIAPYFVAPTGLTPAVFEENCFSPPGSNCVGIPNPPGYKAENGTVLASPSRDAELIYSILSLEQNGQNLDVDPLTGLFSLQPRQADPLVQELVKNPNLVASGQYTITIEVCDASGLGLCTQYSQTLVFGDVPVNCSFLMQSAITGVDETIIPTINPSGAQSMGQGAGFMIGSQGGLLIWTSKYDTVPGPNQVPTQWNGFYPNAQWTSTGALGTLWPAAPGEPWVWLWGNSNDPPATEQPPSQDAAGSPILTTNLTTYTSPTCAGKDTSQTRSIDLSYGPSWCDSGPSGLTQGTAYMTITIKQIIPQDQAYIQSLGGVSTVGTSMQAYLQYRKEPAGAPDPWSDNPAATGWPAASSRLQDIEGNFVNSLPLTDPSGILNGKWQVSAQDDYRINGGTLYSTNDITPDMDPYPIDYWAMGGGIVKNFWQTANSVQSVGNNQFTIEVSRTIAFNKTGGYRLILSALEGTQTSLTAAEQGASGCTYQYTNDNNCAVFIEYGDFYYPNGTQQSWWRYEISKEGSPTQVAAQNYDSGALFPGQAQAAANMDVVYAREPFFRYVTRFYTDQQLTQPWTPTSGDNLWFMYKYPNNTPNNFTELQNGYPGGNDSSWVGTGVEQLPGQQGYAKSQRRWIAKFDINGEKVSRSFAVTSLPYA